MKILFVADGRSPTTLSWMNYWINNGDEVHLVSTYPCEPPQKLQSFSVIAAAYSRMASVNQNRVLRKYLRQLYPILSIIRSNIGPLSLPRMQKEFIGIVETISPDIVHALRIPYEGILSYVTPKEIPFIVSIWGNDLTLHARKSPVIKHFTRKVINRANALFADTKRDIRIANDWGLDSRSLTHVVPGSGGIDLDTIAYLDAAAIKLPRVLQDKKIIVNPRGLRPGSIRQDIFIQAIPRILEQNPNLIFILPSMEGETQIEKRIIQLGIQRQVFLWPKLDQIQLWALYKQSMIYVSPSIHDGVPNSLLEAMACGCFPVVGNIESMREWIVDKGNGLLVNGNDSLDMTHAIIKALNDHELRKNAVENNLRLIRERACYQVIMIEVKNLYQQLIRRS